MTATPKILELNAFDMDDTAGLDPAVAELVARRKRTFGPTSMLFYERPLNLVRGEGVWLIDADGSRYLDAYNNVPSVGHCNPRVVEAVSRQMATLNTHSRYLYDIVYTYSEKLLATYPKELSNIVYVCTGSEGIDLAMRIARTVTGGTGFIATDNAYHGNTSAVTEISPSSASTDAPNPNVFFVPAPDTYRLGAEAAAAKFNADVRAAIATMHERGIKLAAFIADSIFSSDGVFSVVPGFLKETLAAVQGAGGLYIADEVQPGFGRTGEAMWGFMRHGIVPDMAVMGKPMGNGFPIGGVVVKPDILQLFGSQNGYFNTFGGNPVAAAAGLAVLEAIEADGLQENARATGAYLAERLSYLSQRHDAVGDVRGVGLYVGVEIVTDQQSRTPDKAATTAAVNGMRERNVLVGTAGKHGNVIKIRPPLCFNRENADALVTALSDSLAAYADRKRR